MSAWARAMTARKVTTEKASENITGMDLVKTSERGGVRKEEVVLDVTIAAMSDVFCVVIAAVVGGGDERALVVEDENSSS